MYVIILLARCLSTRGFGSSYKLFLFLFHSPQIGSSPYALSNVLQLSFFCFDMVKIQKEQGKIQKKKKRE